MDSCTFRQIIYVRLSISEICQSQSKTATVDYLKSHFDEEVELHKIYRYLDKLQSSQKDRVQEISVKHTRKILGGNKYEGHTMLLVVEDFVKKFDLMDFVVVAD
ncbi:MAG: hypothetical protein LBT04_03075 [Prevotellaceae bacterium]|nr:hypothetical protein [Prevotellaceae bacterium]